MASPCSDSFQRPIAADAGRRGRERRGARTGVVGAHLELTAVAVVLAADLAVLFDVRGLGRARGRGRAGDVGDRRDVVPVDPVADPEQQTGDEHADIRGCRRGKGGDHHGDWIGHSERLLGQVERSGRGSILQRLAIEVWRKSFRL